MFQVQTTAPKGDLRLNMDELTELMHLFARGYTVRYIRKWFNKRALQMGDPHAVPNEQQLLQFAVKYADDIDGIRSQLAEDVLRAGLAKKEERVRRLSETAENLEPAAMEGSNLKAVESYRRILKDIRDETEPLGLTIILPDDRWHQLLSDLSERQPSLEATLPEPTPSNESESVQNPTK
jgi:hypothetical protein